MHPKSLRRFENRMLTETVAMSKFTRSDLKKSNPTPKDATEVLVMSSWRHRMRRVEGRFILNVTQ